MLINYGAHLFGILNGLPAQQKPEENHDETQKTITEVPTPALKLIWWTVKLQ